MGGVWRWDLFRVKLAWFSCVEVNTYRAIKTRWTFILDWKVWSLSFC